MDSKIIQNLKNLLGQDNVLFTEDEIKPYIQNTLGIHKKVAGVLIPPSATHIPFIVNLANEFNFSLYPISTGHNWGYGCSLPARENCIILDLHKLVAINIIDATCGLFSIEPGVTQKILSDFLIEHHLQFMIPTTGAGPNCSIIGNALERGYGLTAYTDHLSALLSYEVILPNGEIYYSPLNELGCENLSHYYRWGVGAYLDGLFSQSNFGIVIKATIVLRPIPEQLDILYFAIKDDKKLELMVELIHHILQKYKGTIDAINLMNKARVVSTVELYKHEDVKNKNKNVLDRMLNVSEMAWIGFGPIASEKKVVEAIKSSIQKTLKGKVDKLVFINRSKLSLINKLITVIPFLKNNITIKKSLDQFHAIMDILTGIPNEFELRLAYHKYGIIKSHNENLNPSLDNIGLIWFPPLVPMTPKKIREFTDLINEISLRRGKESLITLTSLSDLCFDATIPIHFNKSDTYETELAWEYYNEMFDTCYKSGFFPYRLDILTMQKLAKHRPVFNALQDKIKKAIDPNNIISPDRY